jgi:hypothetical protein
LKKRTARAEFDDEELLNYATQGQSLPSQHANVICPVTRGGLPMRALLVAVLSVSPMLVACGGADPTPEPAEPAADAVPTATVETTHVQSSGACTLMCIQGYHCVIHGKKQSCVPN